MSAVAPLRILLVEDDPDDYENTKDMLNAIGHDREIVIDWIPAYGAAREAVRRETYDVCLIDYFLGEEHGLTLLGEALSAGVTTPFILLTGRGDRTVEQLALAAGASDYLAKSDIVPATLARAIRHAVERGTMLAVLRATERRFRAVFEHAGDAILLADDDARYVDGNRAALALLGVTREQLLERRVMDMSTTDASAAWRQFLTKGTSEGEIPLRRTDGTLRYADFRAVAGVLPGLHLSVLRDVTERRHAATALLDAQQQLAASERRFRAMIENGEDGISLLDGNLRSIYQSPAVEAISGYSAADAERQSWADFVCEDHRPRVARAVQEILAGPGATTEVEFDLMHRDGTRRTLALRAQNLLEVPAVGAIVTNFRDVTEHKAAERQRDRFFELSLELMCIVGLDGRFRKLNPAWQHTLGWSHDELSAVPLLDFVHPDDRAATELETARLIGGQRSIAFENRYRTRDGAYRRMRWTASVSAEDGMVYATAHDVTDERTAAERDRLLWARSPIPKWLVDATTSRVLDANDATVTMLGYSREELLSVDARSLVLDEEGREARTGTRRLRAKDGRALEIEVVAKPLDLGAGPAIMEVLVDVTERNRARADLHDSEDRYRRIVENISEGVWIYDGAGITKFMNGQMAKMLGTTIEEAVGQPIFVYMEETQIELSRHRLDRRMRGISERLEFRLKRRDGSALWISSHAAPLFDAKGRFESSVELVTDITELRRSQLVARQLAAIVESSSDAILSCDLSGAIRSWNPAAEQLTHYSRDEAIGRPVSMLFSDEAAARGRTYEGSLRRRDGSFVEISLASSPVRDEHDEHGEYRGTAMIIRDVSERVKTTAALRRAEEQLRQAQKMEAIGSLAGGVAHDFNNLLSVILSYADMMIDDLQPADPMRAELDEVRRAGMRATELTRQLLAFSRKQILEPRVLDVNEVVHGVRKMLGRVLGEDVELCLILPEGPAMVHADAGQLEQVIMNLVVNARDAMPTGGRLTIEASTVVFDADAAAIHAGVAPGRYVMLAVTDTGSGMDRETQARIFEPFFTTKDKSKGTGLGLSTVYGIVQQSGGHIWVYSEPGCGTTFKIYLPRTTLTLQTGLIPLVEATTAGGVETILLVEDEPQVRQLIRTLLTKRGYNVLDAANGGEALLVCEQFGARIHLLLTDVVMPRMSGRVLAERLATERPDMAVLFMSGYTENTISQHGVLDAGVEFLAKPITPESLLRKLRTVLDQP